MAALAPVPALVLCFISMLLLILVSISAPVWNDMSFLDADINGRSIHFGEYGWTGSGKRIGYTINESAIGLSDKLLNVATVRNLTKGLVLHTVAAAILFLALLQGCCATFNYSRLHTILMGFTMSFALIFITVAFAIDIILFDLIGERIRADGQKAHLGAATWITLAALILVVLGCCLAAHGAFGDYHDHLFRDGHRHGRRRRRRRRYDDDSDVSEYEYTRERRY